MNSEPLDDLCFKKSKEIGNVDAQKGWHSLVPGDSVFDTVR